MHLETLRYKTFQFSLRVGLFLASTLQNDVDMKACGHTLAIFVTHIAFYPISRMEFHSIFTLVYTGLKYAFVKHNNMK